MTPETIRDRFTVTPTAGREGTARGDGGLLSGSPEAATRGRVDLVLAAV